jgi:cytochrome b6-f complex iron-sulfur subunit
MENAIPYESPSLSRRQLLNFLTGATVAATVGGALYPAAKFLVPPREASEGGGMLAKDKFGNPIPASQILAYAPGSRALIAGLAGEPTYLTVKEDQSLSDIGIVNNFPLERSRSAVSMPLPWVALRSRGQRRSRSSTVAAQDCACRSER